MNNFLPSTGRWINTELPQGSPSGWISTGRCRWAARLRPGWRPSANQSHLLPGPTSVCLSACPSTCCPGARCDSEHRDRPRRRPSWGHCRTAGREPEPARDRHPEDSEPQGRAQHPEGPQLGLEQARVESSTGLHSSLLASVHWAQMTTSCPWLRGAAWPQLAEGGSVQAGARATGGDIAVQPCTPRVLQPLMPMPGEAGLPVTQKEDHKVPGPAPPGVLSLGLRGLEPRWSGCPVPREGCWHGAAWLTPSKVRPNLRVTLSPDGPEEPCPGAQNPTSGDDSLWLGPEGPQHEPAA